MTLDAGGEEVRILESLGEGRWVVDGSDLRGTMERRGRAPLPPYIRAERAGRASLPDRVRSQSRLGRGPNGRVSLYRGGARRRS